MKCPLCGVDEDRVIDSRPARDGHAVRRRRECSSCGGRYTTYEAPEENRPLLLKSDGSREPFDRTKVHRGITIACNKRPVTVGQIDEITSSVESAVLTFEGGEVSTQQIGFWVLEQLREVDEVAYVRFASVFRRYESIDEFTAELNQIQPDLH